MELDARLIITIGGMLASIITSFIVVRQKVAELEEDLRNALKKNAELDSRLDRNDNATDLVGQRLSVLTDMLHPDKREKLHRSLEKMDVQIDQLRADVSILQKMHNGSHPVVERDDHGNKKA